MVRGGRAVAGVVLALAAVLGALALVLPDNGNGGPAAPAAGGRLPGAASPARSLASPGQFWRASLHVAMPADRPVGPRPACALLKHQPGWSARENAKPGDLSFAVPGSHAGPVQGYLDWPSTVCGDAVHLHLSGPDLAVRVSAYRIGWYGGAGARRVWTSPRVQVRPEPVPAPDPATGLVAPSWPVTLTITPDRAWTPGVYVLVPRDDTGFAGPAIPLVVRDIADRTPVLVKESDLTWNAYDGWGGFSLYHGQWRLPGTTGSPRGYAVSLQRPLTDTGYHQMEFLDLPAVRTAEHLGLDVAYTTDVDVDAQPSQLLGHGEIVSGGHSEYWTRRMLDGVEAARNAGVNVVFLGANDVWWQARLEGPTPDGRPTREVVYRRVGLDPVGRRHPADATVRWNGETTGADRAALLGQSYAAIGVHGSLQLLDAPAWLLAGTGLHRGSLLTSVVGNEADGYNALAPNPPADQVLAAGVLDGPRGPVTVSMDYSTTPSGAAVFAAGTTDWTCELAGVCQDVVPPDTTVAAVRRITRNVLLALARPRAGLRHPAVGTGTPSQGALVAAGAVGSYAPAASENEGTAAGASGHGPARTGGTRQAPGRGAGLGAAGPHRGFSGGVRPTR